MVIATRDRADELRHTLGELRRGAPDTPVIVVDNGSVDDTVAAARGFAPAVSVVALGRNVGSAARTTGVRAAGTRYVAFCDDDSWWAAGHLDDAEALLEAHPEVGALVARTLVGPGQREDPVNTLLAHSPLGRPAGLPGPRVLGFLACACVVRTDAYLQVGGFEPLLHFAAEERLLALDLASAGWPICHVPDLTVHHWPSVNRPASRWRRRREHRNDLIIDWMRRPLSHCLRRTGMLAVRSTHDLDALMVLAALPALLPRAWRLRTVLRPDVEALARAVERGH